MHCTYRGEVQKEHARPPEGHDGGDEVLKKIPGRAPRSSRRPVAASSSPRDLLMLATTARTWHPANPKECHEKKVVPTILTPTKCAVRRSTVGGREFSPSYLDHFTTN